MEFRWQFIWGNTRSCKTKGELCREAMCIYVGLYDSNLGVIQLPGKPMVTVHNMVCTSLLQGSHVPINLHRLASLLPCSSYNRKRFAAMTLRIDNPKSTALLFTSGKLVITGVKIGRAHV